MDSNIYRDKFFFTTALFSKQAPTFPSLHGGATSNDNKWSTLPKFILYYLLKFLTLRTHIPLLRSVCNSWRSRLPLPQIPKIPLGFDAPSLPNSTLPLLLHHSTFFLLSPLRTPNSLPWIVRVADFTHQLGHNRFQLNNPIDGGPFLQPNPSLIATVNLFDDCNVTQLSHCFTLFGGCSGSSLFDKKLKGLSEKAVGNWDFNSGYIVTVLAKVRNCGKNGGLVYLKLGKLEWTEVKNMKVEKINFLKNFNVGDIVFYDEEFFAFDVSSWKVGIIDPNDDDLENTTAIEFIDGPSGVVYTTINDVDFVNVDGHLFGMKGVHFVPSKDGLYLVFEVCGYEEGVKQRLIVFELDEEEWEWNRVESIGEQVFFIGRDVAFSVASERLPGWKSGSVCLFSPFENGCMEVSKGELPEGLEMLESVKYQKYWEGFRVYNMDEDEKGIVGFKDLSKEVYTGLFFPPPPWVKCSCPRLDNVEVKLHNLKLSDGDDDGVNVAANGGTQMILEEVD